MKTAIIVVITGLLCASVLSTLSAASGIYESYKDNSFDVSLGEKRKKMDDLDITDRYRNTRPQDMPAIVTTTENENHYLISLLNSAIEVLEGKRSLAENDRHFGSGKYFSPKDLSKPTKLSISYDFENFKFGRIFLNFKRPTQTSQWCSAAILFAPKNFPTGVYKMMLQKSSFATFELQKAYHEVRPNEEIKAENVFVFQKNESTNSITLKFEAKPGVSNINNHYPESFHAVTLTKNIGDCKI